MSTLRETLKVLNQSAEIFSSELDNAGYNDYSFSESNSPYDLSFLSLKALAARGDLIAAAERVLRLAKGPQGCLWGFEETGLEIATIQALTQLGVPDKIPLQNSVPYKELAESVEISPQLLKRMVRYAVLAGFLIEDETGAVGHSAMSAVFLHNPTAGDGFRFMFDILAPAYSHLHDSIRLDPTGSNPRDGPTAIAFQKDSGQGSSRPTIWEVMDRNPIQRAYFHSMRLAGRDNPSRLLRHTANAFDWSLVRTLVDVGGSLGHASVAIAEKFNNIQITVQDLPDAVERGRQSLPVSFNDRISFKVHDFFLEQTTVADAYLLRNVLYDWPDIDCERIVRSLVPALRPNARLLIMEDIISKWGEKKPSTYVEKYLRMNDISMFSACSGKGRTLKQFCKLIERCDSGFRFEGIYCPPGSVCSLISWVYMTE